MARESKLKAVIEEKKREIGSLQEKIGVERLAKLKAQFDKERERVQQRCEVSMKKGEDENVTELKKRILELEGEKKKWVCNIAKLRDENCKLVEEKREAESTVEIWKKKFDELNERLLLVNGGGNNEGGSGVPFGGNGEKEMMKIDVGSVPLNRNEDFQLSTRKSPSIPSKNYPGTSGGRLGMRNAIDTEDSYEDTCKTMARKETTSGSRQKNLPSGQATVSGILKRKIDLSPELERYINNLDDSDGDTNSSSSSSSSSGSFDIDSLPLSSLASNKKMATEATSLGLNSSSRGK